MRKIFIALSLFCALGLSAENVSQDQAKQIAEDFLRQSRSRAAVSLRMVYDGESSASRSSGQAPALYVFDNEGRNGFVVVSGDDAAYPILGYSYDGDFPEGQLPENFESWLQEMEKQVNYLRAQGAPTMVGSRAEDVGSVVKQLNTAKWSQDAPYNKLTPTVGGKKSPTGCTATALAIVMRHLEWPKTRTVEIPSYKNKTDQTTIASRPAGATYNWDNMLLEYKQGAYTDSQSDEVADFMADVAFMLESDFGSEATGASAADVPIAVVKYMDYDKSCRFLQRHQYSATDWYKLVKDELDANRPVFYTGFNDKAGHAFVLDGYTTNDYFSVNWGWGGYLDGQFRLDAMNPAGSGIGGNNDHYNSGQGAIFGLKKDEGGEWASTMILGEKGFTNFPAEFKKGTQFSVTMDGIGCSGSGYFNGNLLWAVTDKNGTIKEQLVVYAIKDLQVGYSYDNWKLDLTIQNTLKVGDRLRVFYKPTGASDWTLMKGGDKCTWEVILKEEVDIDANVSLKYERGSKRLIVKATDDITVKLFTEDGQDVSNRLETTAQGKVINASRMTLGTYVLRLEVDEEQYREVKLKLGEAQ